jgi:capsule polysaccharide export protein KpsE/RkpR
MIDVGNRVIDAIATLTGLTPREVYDKIQEDEFAELAIKALTAFSMDYHAPSRRLIEKKADTAPIDDITILESCLEEMEAELQQLKAQDRPDAKKLQELQNDAENLRQRLEIAKE